MEYPKIQSLYKRQGVSVDPITGKNVFSKQKKHPLIIGQYSQEEFGLIKHWHVFEKIDGTNVRIAYKNLDGVKSVLFQGRSADAQMPPPLLKYLQETFTVEKLDKVFPEEGVYRLFGEGYGPKIQSGGNYRDDVSFILFDIYVDGWWLQYEDRLSICRTLGIDHVPVLGYMSEEEIVWHVKSGPKSMVARNKEFIAEGMVCCTEPMLRLRNGDVLKFKLKCVDFTE